MGFHQLLADWSQWFWPAFANHLWQATFFAFVVWGAVKLFDQAPARLRYFLWLSALVKFLAPSALLVWLIGRAGVDLSSPVETVQSATRAAASGITWFYTETRIILQTTQPASPVEQTSMANVTPVAATTNYHSEFICALTVACLLGAVTLIALWLIRRWRFARSMRGARIITSGREFDALKRARSWLFVNREIALVASSQVRAPGVWRVRRPVIVLPEGVADRLSDEEIEAVMMHELVHTLHSDNLIGNLQMIFCSLFWFHPLAWLIDRRLLAEREMWCDETVIRLSGEPKLYANSLWKVAQLGLGWPVAGVSRVGGSNLKRRLERMLKSNGQWEMTISRRAAAYASFFALALLFVLVGLPGASAFAQRNKIEASDKKELAQGVKGGVPVGVPGGISGGIPGGVPGGVIRGVNSGISDGIGVVESQRSNKWELIKQAPEFLMQVENRNDSPLLIKDARVRVMGWEFKKGTALSIRGDEKLKVMADEENQGPKDPKSAEVIIAQFKITLVNQTDRRITGVVLEYKNPGLRGGRFQIGPQILPKNSPIEPHGSYVIGQDMLHHHLRALGGVPGGVPGGIASASDDPTLFTINIAGVRFENEPDVYQLNSSKRRSSQLDRDLYEAAESGDIASINELLNAGADVNCALGGDGSPLIGASRKGRLAAVRLLLDRGADPNMPVSGDGNPLIMAAREGRADVVLLLLDRGASIDQMVPGDENALIQASGAGHLNVVKLLVRRGADVNARTLVERANGESEWRTPLSMARIGGHDAVIAFLLAAGARE